MVRKGAFPIIGAIIIAAFAYFIATGTGIIEQFSNFNVNDLMNLPASFTGGGTTLSLDDAKFRSSSNWWTGNTWILTLSQGGMGQSWYGNIDKEDIGQDSGETPENDFNMNIAMTKQACRYELYKDSTMKKVYKYYKVEWDNPNILYNCDNTADVKSHCSNGEVADSGRYYGSGIHNCYCIGAVRYTNALGGLKPAVVHSDIKVGIDTGSGFKYMTTTLPSGTKNLDFRDVGIDAYGIWTGYTSTQVCDTFIAREKDKYYTFYQTGWKIGLTEYYDDYKNVVSNFDSWRISGSRDPPSIDGQINSLNSASVRARSVFNPSTGRIIGTYDESAATAYYENVLKSPIQNPQWTFYIKADELGISQPIPKARIDSAITQEFGSGERGRIDVRVMNIGESGNINVWATCQSPFSTSYSLERYISANSVSTFVVEVDANVNIVASGTCEVCAKGAGQTGQDCKIVYVKVNPQKVCTANSQVCEGNLIKRCNAAGSGWDTISDCAAADKVCKYDGNGIPICLAPDKDIPDDGFDIIQFLKMWLIGAGIALLLVILGVVFIPPLRIILIASPMLALVAIIVLGFLLAIAFSAPVASLAATLL